MIVRKCALAAGLAAVLTSSVASAQLAPMVLRQGTPIAIKLRSDLDSKTAQPGDRFEFQLADHLMVGGVVVVPAGTTGIGEVTRANHNANFWRDGRIETRPVSIDYLGHHIDLAAPTPEQIKHHMVGGTPAPGVTVGVTAIRERTTRVRQPNGRIKTHHHYGAAAVGPSIVASVAASAVATIIVGALSRGAEDKIDTGMNMLAYVQRDTVVDPAGTFASHATMVANRALPAPGFDTVLTPLADGAVAMP